MNRLLFKNFRLFCALLASLFLCKGGYGQAQIVNTVWSANTFSASVDDTTTNSGGKLAFTVSIPDLTKTEVFTLALTDKENNSLVNLGEYRVKKHANGFYYVEETRSHELRTVLGNEVYFLFPIQADQLYTVKNVSLKVKGRRSDKSELIEESTVKSKVPKYKKPKSSKQ